MSGLAARDPWTKTSGPGAVAFGNAERAAHDRDLRQLGGTYVLTLTANDGELTGSDTVTVTVTPARNLAPTVNAGPDQSLTLPTATASLAGTRHRRRPARRTVTTQWTKVSGPGTVTFGNAAASLDDRDLLAPGPYVLQLTANDGAVSSSDTITITVDSKPANKAIDFGGTNALRDVRRGARSRRLDLHRRNLVPA